MISKLITLSFAGLCTTTTQTNLRMDVHAMFREQPAMIVGCKPIDEKRTVEDSIRIKIAGGNVYFLDCVNGEGGGNVAASVGEDGILLVDDMLAVMGVKLKAALATVSDKPVKMVLNTHYHFDHIEGNRIFQKTSTIIAQENIRKRLRPGNRQPASTVDMLPAITFTDSISLNFNGEEIRMIHFPNSHTDGDAVIYFSKSNVLHLGDMFFFEMFPAVYTEGGGNIKQLVLSLEKILTLFPSDAIVIPGHGRLATMKDLEAYVTMLKETIALVEASIRAGKTAEEMTKAKLLAKYDVLGSGGAQTTDQYLSMLYKLLGPMKK